MTLSMTFLFGTIINQGSSVIKIHSAPAWGSQFLQTFSSYLNHEPPYRGRISFYSDSGKSLQGFATLVYHLAGSAIAVFHHNNAHASLWSVNLHTAKSAV